ncbi:hypothetical protein C9374_012870 [Naegleria lovaniensis]|uniref:Protein kinase domain-containing protein n=1 Tax=Naegleria lovaniensis TaxID=51637 RepID=A0AA88GE26_NAELO|nr:uncharacterized protein C9374_012870 [Naegleria lovaniensis]KAG2373138.1 hypothetical protein C9374_012870 [Naegleria lovaniensis]
MHKVLVRFERGIQTEKIVTQVSAEISYQILVKKLLENFEKLDVASETKFQIHFFNETLNDIELITSDDGIKSFVSQISKPNVKRENKCLIFKVIDHKSLQVEEFPAVTNTHAEKAGTDLRFAPTTFEVKSTSTTAPKHVITKQQEEPHQNDSRLAPNSFLVENKECVENDSRIANTSFHVPNSNVQAMNEPSMSNDDISETAQEEKKFEQVLNENYGSLQFIATGGFGQVYKGINKKNGRQVAVKVMKTSDWEDANKVIKEFQRMVQLEHENIVKTFKSYFAGGMKSIVIEMELMIGSLYELIISKKVVLNEKMVLKILKESCQALEWIQSRHNIVHRDIKPHNILIRRLDLQKEEIEIGLCDFGMARSIESVNNTTLGGTNLYFSPEVMDEWNGRSNHEEVFSFSSDVFALGVSIYQLMTFDMSTTWSTLSTQSTYENIQKTIHSNLKSNSFTDFIVELLIEMLKSKPTDRITTSQILNRIALYQQYQYDHKLDQHCSSTSQPSSTWHVGLVQNFLGDMYHRNDEESSKALEWYMKAADNGNAQAQFALAEMYEKGQGIEVDIHQAKSWYEKSAVGGHAQAQYKAGVFCEFDGTHKKAMDWFLKAAGQGIVDAQYRLGVLYWKSDDEKQAIRWLTEAASQSHIEAMEYIGDIYDSKQEYEKALEWYEKCSGTQHVQFKIATIFKYGLQNECKAFEWYLKSAENGHPNGQYSLGDCYRNGSGVSQDFHKAMEWYEKSANQGFYLAQKELGNIYENASQQFCSEADFELGILYERGQDGIGQDITKALDYFNKAAKSENSKSQLHLGQLYEHGHLVQQDISQALYWYEKAANNDNKHAQFLLGRMYEAGVHVNRDLEQALNWYDRASTNFNVVANLHKYLLQRNLQQYSTLTSTHEDFDFSDEMINKYMDISEMATSDVASEVVPHCSYSTYFNSLKWNEELAQKGNHFAQHNLGYLYWKGIGVEKHIQKALEYFETAANNGNGDAQLLIGLLLKNGEDEMNLLQSISRGVEFLEKSANQNNLIAQVELGKYHEQQQNMQKQWNAYDWYSKADDPRAFVLSFEHGLVLNKTENECFEEDDPLLDENDELLLTIDKDGTFTQNYDEQEEEYNPPTYGPLDENNDHTPSVFSTYVPPPMDPAQLELEKEIEKYERDAKRGDVHAQVALAKLYEQQDPIVHDRDTVFWYSKAAQTGHVESQLALARYFKSRYNLNEAVIWFKKAASNGSIEANYECGLLYQHHLSDSTKAIECLEKAAAQSHVESMKTLGSIYESTSFSNPTDGEKAIEWYLKCVESGGYDDLYFNMAFIYENSLRNPKTAFEWYLKSAESGDERSQFKVAVFYRFGLSVTTIDVSKAMEWYEKSAKNGYAAAQQELGTIYEIGDCGQMKDYSKSFYWYSQCDPKCNIGMVFFKLGEYYRTGKGVEVNYEKAFENYEKAINLFVTDALYPLGLLYERGLGVQQDCTKALECFEKVANEGFNALSLIHLGDVYLYGKIVEKDISKAIHYYERVATSFMAFQKQHYGNFMLGLIYETGIDVERNLSKALEYYEKAMLAQNLVARFHWYLLQRNAQNYVKTAQWDSHDFSVLNWLSTDFYDIWEENTEHTYATYSPALEWYEQLANTGDHIAQNNLAYIYWKGIGVEKNILKAFEYFEKAANNGNGDAQLQMALVFLHDDRQGSCAKGIEMLEKKASLGNMGAQFELGTYYETNQEYSQALTWYEQSASQGFKPAMLGLGNLYEKGLGVEQNAKEALLSCYILAPYTLHLVSVSFAFDT